MLLRLLRFIEDQRATLPTWVVQARRSTRKVKAWVLQARRSTRKVKAAAIMRAALMRMRESD